MYEKYYVVKWKKDNAEIQSVSFTADDHESMEEFIFRLLHQQGIEEIWKETTEYWRDE